MNDGTHFDLEQQRPAEGFNIIHEKVKSFRLEPLQPIDPKNISVFSVDGEYYEQQIVQASMSERTLKTFV